VVADSVITQVDVLDAREFTYKLGQEVQFGKILSL
jgi:hypothetical protein